MGGFLRCYDTPQHEGLPCLSDPLYNTPVVAILQGGLLRFWNVGYKARYKVIISWETQESGRYDMKLCLERLGSPNPTLTQDGIAGQCSKADVVAASKPLNLALASF